MEQIDTRYPWDPADLGPEDVAVVLGRRAPFAMVADWVGLADIPSQASRLYWIYVMHLNRSRGDQRAWPTRRSLAKLLNVDGLRTVDRSNKILSELGAIDVHERWVAPKVRGANLVVVHETPPEGYTGPVSLEDFYRRLKATEKEQKA